MISNVKNAFIMKNQKSKFSVNILPIMNLYRVPIDVYSVGQAICRTAIKIFPIIDLYNVPLDIYSVDRFPACV